MPSLSAEERAAFIEQLQRLLADKCRETDVRRAMETREGFDPSLWRELAKLGVLGLVIGEDYGGTGASAIELERVMEEVGAALLCGPLLSSAVLAATMIQSAGDGGARKRLLPGIADGSRIATVALSGTPGVFTRETVAVEAHAEANGIYALSGMATFVAHAETADTLLVAANSQEGIELFELDGKAHGVGITRLPTFDHSQRLTDVRFDKAAARKLSSNREGWAAAEAALDLARIALAGEEAGAARRVLAMTVEYAKTRIQFGRAIGSFQAIKHMAAELLLETESAISAARYAADAHASGATDAKAAISLAAFACADTFVKTAATSIQMHGGIAFTWAHPAHLYLRRARADAELLGSPAFHRERYLQQLGA